MLNSLWLLEVRISLHFLSHRVLTLEANDCISLSTATVPGLTFLTGGAGVKVLFFPGGDLVVTATERTGTCQKL